ncbi:MAG: glycosyl hydrolase family 95 catalytic domain-containing protein [Christensenellales bacterium]|jgi:alpha-L-fucosidase 2
MKITMHTEAFDLLPKHDLVCLSPVPDPMYGIPIGTGKTGGLLWTDDRRMYMQINDTDLIDDGEKRTDRYTSETDECNTVCVNGARLTLDFGCPVFEAIYQEEYEARLKLAEGEAVLDARTPFLRVSGTAFASAKNQVLAVRIESEGGEALPLTAELERWGSRTFMYWYSATAGSPKDGLGGTASACEDSTAYVTQELRGLSFCAAVRFIGETAPRAQSKSSHGVRMCAKAAEKRAFEILVALAEADTVEAALRAAKNRLDAAERLGFAALHSENAAFWRDFWGKSFVSLPQEYDFAENLYYLNLYFANCQMRGKYPPHFCNGVWGIYHDFVPWNLYFHYNSQQAIFPLDPAGHPELTETYYRFRMGQLDVARRYAREIKGADGAFYTDVCDMKGRMSKGTQNNCTCGTQIALSMYSHYLYTGDADFLETCVKPMLTECAAYYMSAFKKGADGLYHIHATQGYEGSPLMDDSITDLSAVRALLSAAIAAMPENEAKWREVLDNLAPFETAEFLEDELDEHGNICLGIGTGRKPASDCVLSVGRSDEGVRMRKTYGNPVHEFYGFPDTEMAPVFPARLVGAKDRETDLYKRILNSIYLHSRAKCMGWCMMPIYMARMGLCDMLWGYINDTISEWMIHPQGFGTYSPDFVDEPVRKLNAAHNHKTGEIMHNFAIRFRHFDVETAPILATAVNEALLASYDGILRLFPAVSPDMEVAFSLYAAGGFIVRAMRSKGGFAADIVSSRGGTLRVAVDAISFEYAIDNEAPCRKAREVYAVETAPGQTVVLRGDAPVEIERDASPNRSAKRMGRAILGIEREFAV